MSLSELPTVCLWVWCTFNYELQEDNEGTLLSSFFLVRLYLSPMDDTCWGARSQMLLGITGFFF